MATPHTAPMCFWHRLNRGPWDKPVTDRITDALDALVRRLRTDAAVAAVLVFGSYARGDFGRKSDLDLLILTHTRSKEERIAAERRIIQTVVDAEAEARLPVHVAPLLADSAKPAALGPELLHDLWTDGVVLFGEAAALAALRPGELAPWSVVRFSLHNVPPRDRVRLARRLHGRSERPGIIRLPGLDLARGAAFVPTDQARAVRAALDDAGAAYDIIPVWREV
ncbi:MAG: nucleotidyltransferase domain-containing protein [Chloroflexota bacterium]